MYIVDITRCMTIHDEKQNNCHYSIGLNIKKSAKIISHGEYCLNIEEFCTLSTEFSTWFPFDSLLLIFTVSLNKNIFT